MQFFEVRVPVRGGSCDLDHARREVDGEDAVAALRQRAGERPGSAPDLQGIAQAPWELPEQKGVVVGVVIPPALSERSAIRSKSSRTVAV